MRWSILAFATLSILLVLQSALSLRVELTAKPSEAQQIEIRVKDSLRTILSEPGKVDVFRADFGLIEPDSIRIDFGNTATAELEVDSLRIFRGGQLLSEWRRPKERPACCFSDSEEIGTSSESSIHLRARHNDPFWIAPISDFVGSEDFFMIPWLVKMQPLSAAILAIQLLIIGLCFRVRNASQLAALVLIIFVFNSAPQNLVQWIHSALASTKDSPPHDGISASTFLNIPKRAEVFALYAACASIALLGAGLGLLQSLRRVATPIFEGEPKEASDRRLLIAVLFVLAAAPFLYRPVATELERATTAVFSNDWDSLNVNSWLYGLHNGQLPYRDFWNPYGGQLLLASKSSLGFFLSWSHRLLILIAFVVAWRAFTNSSLRWGLVFLTTTALLFELGMLSSAERYLTPLAVLLLTHAIFASPPTALRGLLLVLPAVWAGFIEPNQVVQTGFAFVCGVAFEMWRRSKNPAVFLGTCRMLGIATAAFAACIFAAAVALQKTNLSDGFVFTMRNLGALMQSARIPADVRDWAGVFGGIDSVFFYIVLSTIFPTAFLLGHAGTRRSIPHLSLAISIAILLSIQLFKQIIRPSIAHQVMALFALAALFAIGALVSSRTGPSRKTANLLLAVLVPFAVAHAEGFDVKRLWGQGASFPESIAATFWPSPEQQRSLQNQFRPEQFQYSWGSGADFKTFFFEKYGPNASAYALGELPQLPIFLRTPIRYFSTSWDSAPRPYQIRMRELLEANPPDVLVLPSNILAMDNISVTVRWPLILDFAFHNYTFDSQFGAFDFLIRRKPKSSDFRIWTKHFGKEVQLGFIPSFSAERDYQSCEQGCTELLIARFQSPVPLGPHRLNFQVDGNDYSIVFFQRADNLTAVIPLGRIWFWNAAKAAGIEPLLQEGLGFQVEVKKVEVSDQILY